MIQHSAPFIGPEEYEACARVLRSGRLAQGPEVEAFEAECAAFVGRRYAVAVNSGTNALHLALAALGVGPGDTVHIPTYSCAALLTAVALQGARPVLCDCTPDFNMDASAVPAGAVAIAPHLFGKRAVLPESATVIEDIAQSMGGGTGAGSCVAITSFYATKLMSTGEGGMLFTDDEGLAEFARDRRDYDNRDDFQLRYSYKMTDLQAALGRVQLKRLPGFIQTRRAIAARYTEAFMGLPLELPGPENHVFFRYVVGVEARTELESHLRGRGIEAKRPVYCPAHRLTGVDSGGMRFPHADHAHACALSLPAHPVLIEDDVQNVIESCLDFFH